MAATLALHPSAHSFSSSSTSSNPSPASTLCTSTDDELHTDYNPPRKMPQTPRKIRFAPLPDPRREILVTEDGEEIPLPDSNRDDDCTPPASISAIPNSPSPAINILPSSPVTPSDTVSVPPTSPASWSAPPQQFQHRDLQQQSSKPRKSNIFLRPFQRRSATADTQAPASSSSFNITTEDILTLGTINLFRTSSRDSRRSVNSTDSASSTPPGSLARWASRNSFNQRSSSKGSKSSDTLPIYRTQSLGTGTTSSSSSHLSRTPPTPASRSQAVGKRMLNGRVYGSKNNKKHSSNANPFANVRDEEPEFVEWGYGGMGSVKNNSANHDSSIAWSKVQSGGTALGHDVDDDDGSGTAWIRKRREERARKAREEKERAEAAAASPATEAESTASPSVSAPSSTAAPSTASPSSSPPSSTTTTGTSPPPADSSVTSTAGASSAASSSSSPAANESPPSVPAPSASAPTPTAQTPIPTPREEQHHVLTISAPLKHTHSHHAHHHSHSRSASAHGSALNLKDLGAKDASSPGAGIAQSTVGASVGEVQNAAGHDEAKVKIGEDEQIASPSGSASSESASSGSEESESEDDDDEDDEQVDGGRKTAISAGLEKISRHKDP